jgi:hypothetical protein
MLVLTAAVLLAVMLTWAVASSYLSSREDEVVINRVPCVVSYSDTAGPDELGMPFYPGAEREETFAYTIRTEDGRTVVEYASSRLATAASLDEVAAYYMEKLPGGPPLQTIEDEAGPRAVLAVADDREVRSVTIRSTETGTIVELVRATKPITPTKPLRPRGRERST